MKTIIIDGNNLMHKLYGNANNQLVLVHTVRSFVNKKDKIIFFFDGFGDINISNVIFSEKKKADDLMREFIEKFKNHRLLKVISSDREISGLAKVCGCEVQSSEDFRNEINKDASKAKSTKHNYTDDDGDKEKPTGMSRKSLEEFRKMFE